MDDKYARIINVEHNPVPDEPSWFPAGLGAGLLVAILVTLCMLIIGCVKVILTIIALPFKIPVSWKMSIMAIVLTAVLSVAGFLLPPRMIFMWEFLKELLDDLGLVERYQGPNR